MCLEAFRPSIGKWTGCLHDRTARRLGCDVGETGYQAGMTPLEVLLQQGDALEAALVLRVPHAIHVVVALLLVVVLLTKGAEQRGLPLAQFGREVVRDGDGWEDDRLLLPLQLGLCFCVQFPLRCYCFSCFWLAASVLELDGRVFPGDGGMFPGT